MPVKNSHQLFESIASDIIQRYHPSVDDIRIVCESACVTDEFVKSIRIPIRISNHRLEGNFLLFLIPQSQYFITSVLGSSVNATSSKYVVLLDCDNCVTVASVLELCWQNKLLNVVVALTQNNNTPIYTYFPFREGSCFDPSPVLIDWFVGSFEFNVDLFPQRKVWNLHNCTLKVSSFTYGVVHIDGGQIKGPFARVFRAVAGAMNFSWDLINVAGEEQFGLISGPKKSGLRRDVYTGQAQLGFQFLQPMDFHYLDYDSLAMTLCVTWCVPVTYKTKTLWWLVVGEFAPSIWFMLFISGVIIIATDLVSQKNNRQPDAVYKYDMFLNVLGAFLQASGRSPRYSSFHLRTLWISWAMSSVVLSTAYIGALNSFRTAPVLKYAINNLEELADSEYQAWYAKGLKEVIDINKAINPAVSRLVSKAVMYSPDQRRDLINRLRSRNITALMMDKICHLTAMNLKVDLHPLPDDCMQMSTFHLFVMEKNSVYTEVVSILMGRLTQAGVVQKSVLEMKNSSASSNFHLRPLHVRAMLSAFVLLGGGLLFSLTVFVVECTLFSFSGKMKERLLFMFVG